MLIEVKNLYQNSTSCKKDNRPWQSGVTLKKQGLVKSCKSINAIHDINRKKMIILINADKSFDKF